MFAFGVIKAHALEETVLAQKCGRRSVRNWAMQLEYGQGSRLCQYLRGVIPWLPVDIVHTCIRTPSPYATLVANGVWNHFCLPDSTASGTWCVPRMGWRWLAPNLVPTMPTGTGSIGQCRVLHATCSPRQLWGGCAVRIPHFEMPRRSIGRSTTWMARHFAGPGRQAACK